MILYYINSELLKVYKPGYKLFRWVLASESITTITKDTKLTYENNTILEPIYELDNYNIVYKARRGLGINYNHRTSFTYETEVILEEPAFSYLGQNITGWKVINLANDINNEGTLESEEQEQILIINHKI